MTPDQREMYRMAGVNRAADIAGRWNITRQALVVQPLLLTAIVAQMQTGKTFLPYTYLALAGLMASIIGYGLLKRAGDWIELWTDDATALEETADDRSKRVFGGRNYVSLRSALFSSGRLIRWASGSVAAGWFFALLVFLRG